MIEVKFKIDVKQLESFDNMCMIIGEDQGNKIRTKIAEELNLFRQQQRKREVGKRDGLIEIGVQHTIPLAY